MLAFWVIGAMLIGLGVIGLSGAIVIRPLKISENITGQDLGGRSSEISQKFENYYPGEGEGGLLGMLRMARRPPQSSGRDVE
jgi:hypothetical protein